MNENQLRILRLLLEDARKIATMDKTANSPDGYAHALGRCNGMGKIMVAHIECLIANEKNTSLAELARKIRESIGEEGLEEVWREWARTGKKDL